MTASFWRRALPVLAVLAVLAVLTAVLLDGESAGHEAASVADQSTDANPELASGDELANDSGELPTVDSGVEAAPLELPSPGPEALPSAGAPPAASDPPTLTVLVTDEDDEPLAGVPVVFEYHRSNISTHQNGLAHAETGEDGLAVLDLRNQSFVDGVLTLPYGNFRIAVDLPLQPRVGLNLGNSVEDGRLFPLVVPRDALKWLLPIRVRVVDAEGTPAGGVTVALEGVPRHDRADSGTLERAETATEGDDLGIAEISRAKLIEKVSLAGIFGYLVDYQVSLDGAFHHPPSVAVAEEPSDELLQLELPPHGELVLRVVDQDGEPAGSDASAALFTRPTGSDDDVRWERMHRHIRKAENGVMSWAHVGLDLDLYISVSRTGWRGTSVYEPGPTTDGERLELQATLGAPVPYLTGRVVDQNGAPLPGTWLNIEVLPDEPPPERAGSSPPSSVYFSLNCDAEGAFRYPLYLPASVTGGRSLVVTERRRSGFPKGVVPLYTEVALPEPLPTEGDVDLGVLVMRPLPVLLAGQVVDSNGAPTRRARMFIRYPYGPEGEERWFYLNADMSSLDEDGRFTVHGVQRVRSLKVSATSQGDAGWSEEVVVPPGTRDLVLELVPPEPEPEGGVVMGTVLLDPGIPPLELEVYLKWKGGSEDDYVFPPGMFRFEPVPVGTAVLELELQDTEYAVARVEGIEVRVGETTTVDPIDLRGALAVLPVRVLKDSGKPVANTTCWVSSPGDRGGSFRTDRDGRASLLLPTRHDLFAVRTNGYVPATCGWSTAEQTLVLVAEDG